jgi:hypothetical protein
LAHEKLANITRLDQLRLILRPEIIKGFPVLLYLVWRFLRTKILTPSRLLRILLTTSIAFFQA